MKLLNAETRWPSRCGWTVGLLNLSVGQMQTMGIQFDSAEDDLDTLQTAVLSDRSIGHLRLLSRDHAPMRGVEVQVDASISREQGFRALERQLQLGRDSMIWVTEDAEYVGYRPAHNTIKMGHQEALIKSGEPPPIKSSRGTSS